MATRRHSSNWSCTVGGNAGTMNTSCSSCVVNVGFNDASKIFEYHCRLMAFFR